MANSKAVAKPQTRDVRKISPNGSRHGSRGPIPQLIFGDLWEFDPAPESADPRIRDQYELYIGGKFVPPRSGKYFNSINPATEKVVAAALALGASPVRMLRTPSDVRPTRPISRPPTSIGTG